MTTLSQRRSKGSEFIGVILFAMSAVTFLSLVSYNPSDPSYNVVAHVAKSTNYIGKAGAYFADLLFQIFGLAAFLLPVALVVVAWKKICSRELEALYLKAMAFLFLVCAMATAFGLGAFKVPYEVNFPAGGVIGTICANTLITYFNVTGSLIIVATSLLLYLLAYTRFSFGGSAEWLESRPRAAVAWYRDWAEARRKKRMNRIKEEAPRNKVKGPIARPPIPAAAKALEPEEVFEPSNQSSAVAAQELPVKTDEPEMPEVKEPAIVPTVRKPVRMERTITLAKEPDAKEKVFQFPDIDFLTLPSEHAAVNEEVLMELAKKITAKCAEFGVLGQIVQIHPGPVVTTFELKPDPGIKYSRIINLVDDICLAMKAESIRIDRIPGKSTVGIEVPNAQREIIYLREIIESDNFRRSQSKLPLALGKLINGEPCVTDLTKMPHLLIAGATGAGKSVAINSMITSILYKVTPEEVKFIMIDPKRLELGIYADIPHLLAPIVTEVKAAANALNWAIREMEDRYKRLAFFSVRNIDQFNALVRSDAKRKEPELDAEDVKPLPYIVVIIDELADLMMLAGREVEISITRLGQMARAVGIHLILSTQRPSVDVITGLIKANFPCRISFRVSSKVDSRTILDCNGSEQLLGNGDMLFLPPGSARLTRVHGAYVSEKEAEKIIAFLRQQREPQYDESVLEFDKEEEEEASGEERVLEEYTSADVDDELYGEAVQIVIEMGRASTSVLQRRLKIGYGRAARLLDIMEKEGIIGPPDASKPREVLVGREYLNRSNEDDFSE
jgi:S-DNA-T family DNA segregation ATPase FtsK/SpoIIIE